MSNIRDENTIAARRTAILERLKAAADHPVELVAVSKRQPQDRIDEAVEAGQRVFGENRVQESLEHWAEHPRRGEITLHLIGPLQSKKSEDAVQQFDVIQTLDRAKLVRTLTAAAEKTGKAPDLFVQVNTGDEPQKSGVSVDALPDLLAEAQATYPGKVTGLMCIPPVEEPAGPHFALLKKLADRHGLPNVSMGMSADYELGAKFGATHVRVGSALFGEREN